MIQPGLNYNIENSCGLKRNYVYLQGAMDWATKIASLTTCPKRRGNDVRYILESSACIIPSWQQVCLHYAL